MNARRSLFLAAECEKLFHLVDDQEKRVVLFMQVQTQAAWIARHVIHQRGSRGDQFHLTGETGCQDFERMGSGCETVIAQAGCLI